MNAPSPQPTEVECHPIASLPGTTALFGAFCHPEVSTARELLRTCYPSDPFSLDWAHSAPHLDPAHLSRLTDALLRQTDRFDASGAVLANIERLRNGAAAVVTGQQVGLFGGPLLTLLKAATAIRKAQAATAASGREHVPIFWLASEDHDLAEVDQVNLLAPAAAKPTTVETLHLCLPHRQPLPVGARVLGDRCDEGHQHLEAALDRAAELLGHAPIADLLRECYTPGATLAGAFGRLLSRLFADFGLIVMDAAAAEFHALGADALRAAIEHAAELEAALLARSAELTAAGFHAQVLVTAGHSLLFLLDEPIEDPGSTPLTPRLPLRRLATGDWKAGSRHYTTADLLQILAAEPERLSPNALLRPVFQDCILPTAAYIGGPAEVAYFAQSAVIYSAMPNRGGRITPVLPRLSATLVEPAIAALLAQHELTFEQIVESRTPEALALRLGARAMPIEGKRRLAAVGNALDTELTALTEYLLTLSPQLAQPAATAGSKMRYQMNRLRRLAASFELQKQAALHKQASAIMFSLYPEGHLQERLLGGIQLLAQHGDALPALLVAAAGPAAAGPGEAGLDCPGHRVLYL